MTLLLEPEAFPAASLAATLPLIQNNEIVDLRLTPEGTGIFDITQRYTVIEDDADLDEAGRVIMANTSIQSLTLIFFREASTTKYQSLFSMISQNKSITSIHIRASDVNEGLSQVIHVESLSNVKFTRCNVMVDIFAAVSARGRNRSLDGSLEELKIWGCTFKLYYRPPPIKEALLKSANKEIRVNCLEVCNNALGREGRRAVAKLLVNASKYLENVEFINCTGQDLTLMVSALSDLELQHLVQLDLSLSHINADGARAISDVISHSKTIQTLDLERLHTTEDAWAIMLPACLGHTSSLRNVYLHHNSDITDTIMLASANALKNNCTLETLYMSRCMSVTPAGWMALSCVFGSTCSVLKKVVLWGNNIDDAAIAAFANGLSRNETLEELNLCLCEPVTSTGWQAFSRVLGSTNSVLRNLEVSNRFINDDVVTVFANELSGNEKSKLTHLELNFSSLSDLPVTNVGWNSILNLLCDTSSIDATWSSNHTLTYLGPILFDDSDVEDEDESVGDDGRVVTLLDIVELLEMNEHKDKKQVARWKVIENHFSEDFDVNATLGFEQKLLPRVISWFGRDSLGCPAIYNIIRTMPELCENDLKFYPMNFKRSKTTHDNK